MLVFCIGFVSGIAATIVGALLAIAVVEDGSNARTG